MNALFPLMGDQLNSDIVLEPYKYIVEIPGKEVRSQLISCFNRWLKIDPEHLKKIKDIIQMLHNASLLIDDIEDNSKLRRGVPVAHLIYGIPSTINCANYVYFLAMQHCSNLGNPEALQVFLEEIICLHRGQGFDIYWRDTITCPSEEEYKEMVSAKTGGLFRLAVRMMQAFSTNRSDFIPLVNNLVGQIPPTQKFLRRLIGRLVNILKQKTENDDVKMYAVDYMRKTNSFNYTKKVTEDYKNEITRMIAEHGGNDDLSAVVEQLWLSMP